MKTKDAVFRVDAVAAIQFALEHIEEFEIAAFLRDWRDGRNLRPWVDAAIQDGRLTNGCDWNMCVVVELQGVDSAELKRSPTCLPGS